MMIVDGQRNRVSIVATLLILAIVAHYNDVVSGYGLAKTTATPNKDNGNNKTSLADNQTLWEEFRVDVPLLWLDRQNYPYNQKYHNVATFGKKIGYHEKSGEVKFELTIRHAESAKYIEEAARVVVKIQCANLLSTVSDLELKSEQPQGTMKFNSIQGKECVPLVRGYLTLHRQSMESDDFNVTVTMSVPINELDLYELNEYDAVSDTIATTMQGTGTMRSRLCEWFESSRTSPFSFYFDDRIIVMMNSDEDYKRFRNCDNFAHYARRANDMIHAYECAIDSKSCNEANARYSKFYNRRLFYRPECKLQAYDVNRNSTIVNPHTIYDSAANVFTKYELSNRRVDANCAGGYAAYCSDGHIAVNGDNVHELLTSRWMLFHETGHIYDLYHVDDYIDLRENHVNLFSQLYDTRNYSPTNHWIEGDTENIQSRFVDGKYEVKNSHLESLTVIYSFLAARPMMFRDFQRHMAADPVLKHSFLQSINSFAYSYANVTLLPTIWQLYANRRERQLAFTDITERYRVLLAVPSLYHPSRNTIMYPCFALQPTARKSLIDVSSYEYESNVDRLSALRLCGITKDDNETTTYERNVQINQTLSFWLNKYVHYNSTNATNTQSPRTENKEDNLELYDYRKIEAVSELITTSKLPFYPIYGINYEDGTIMHPMLDFVSKSGVFTDLRNQHTPDWHNFAMIQRDRFVVRGLGDEIGVVITLIREGPSNKLLVSVLSTDPHSYFESWLRIRIIDKTSNKIRETIEINGKGNVVGDKVYDLPTREEILQIEFPECGRLLINNLPSCDGVHAAYNGTMDTKNHLHVTNFKANYYHDMYKQVVALPDINELMRTFVYVNEYVNYLRKLENPGERSTSTKIRNVGTFNSTFNRFSPFGSPYTGEF